MAERYATINRTINVELDYYEKIIKATYSIVNAYRSFWVLSFLLFITLSLVGMFIIFFNGKQGATPTSNLVLNVLALFLYVFTSYTLGVAVCRLSKVPAIIVVVYSIFAIPFLITWLGGVLYANLIKFDIAILLFSLGGLIFAGFFFILLYDFLRGAFWCLKIDDSQRLIAAELYKTAYFSKIALSRTIGLKFSIDNVKFNRLRVLMLFVFSSSMYTVFLATLLFSMPVIGISIVFGSSLFNTDQNDSLKLSMIAVIMPLSTVCIAVASLLLGSKARKVGRTQALSSLSELQHADLRAPVTFLRPFSDDQVQLAQPRLSILGKMFEVGTRENKLDVLLVEEGTNYGPVVGLGNPRDQTPPYGAARGYFESEDWRSGASSIMSSSKAIIICLDNTDGVMWELDYITEENLLSKTLFLMHPRHHGSADIEPIIEAVLKKLLLSQEMKEKIFNLFCKECKGSILGFFIDDGGVLQVGLSSTFSRFAFLSMLRLFFRKKF
ncbi:hypothetical protein [Methylobacterium sp. Leaf100]|uniref:hypothetical protein n=1 Tax=Methylobacterium sp. Leaf100 TaxID=1736252 RepID=UPI000AE606CF|nr:hypothetical protein [Methylobacterium sp. Leaf100]